MAKAKVMRKPLPPATSWWSERRNLLTSLKPKHVKARPKKAKAKPKPKSIKAKKSVKAKKVMKMKKAPKAKKGKAKRTK